MERSMMWEGMRLLLLLLMAKEMPTFSSQRYKSTPRSRGSSQKMAMSLSSDRTIGHAVIINETLQEFRRSFPDAMFHEMCMLGFLFCITVNCDAASIRRMDTLT